MSELLAFVGTDSHGTSHSGATERQAAEFVQAKYFAGWRSLKVHNVAGDEVGGIVSVQHVRTWWGQGSRALDPCIGST